MDAKWACLSLWSFSEVRFDRGGQGGRDGLKSPNNPTRSTVRFQRTGYSRLYMSWSSTSSNIRRGSNFRQLRLEFVKLERNVDAKLAFDHFTVFRGSFSGARARGSHADIITCLGQKRPRIMSSPFFRDSRPVEFE